MQAADGEPPSHREWDSLAIASFALAVIPVVPIIGSVVAISLGLVARGRAVRRRQRGRTLATWAIAIATLVLLLSVVIVAAVLNGVAHMEM